MISEPHTFPPAIEFLDRVRVQIIDWGIDPNDAQKYIDARMWKFRLVDLDDMDAMEATPQDEADMLVFEPGQEGLPYEERRIKPVPDGPEFIKSKYRDFVSPPEQFRFNTTWYSREVFDLVAEKLIDEFGLSEPEAYERINLRYERFDQDEWPVIGMLAHDGVEKIAKMVMAYPEITRNV